MKHNEKVENSIQRLTEGNKRFQNHTLNFVQNTSKEKLKNLLDGQHPIATIVCCVDSRVAPEVLFDVELGELFVFRIPGPVITPEVIETVEFGAEMLKIPLTIIMGHQGCAAIANKVKKIWPDKLSATCSRLHYDESMGMNLDVVASLNTKKSVEELTSKSEVLKSLVEKGEHKIAPAFYNMSLNKVEFH